MQAKIALDTSALDSSFKAHALRGTGRYVSELARHLNSFAFDRFALSTFSQRELLEGGLVSRAIDLLPLARQTLKQQILFPIRASTGRFAEYDLFHFPAHLDAPSWLPAPFAVTVLDLIPLIFQDLYRPKKANWRFHLARKLEIRSIQAARLILAISEQTKLDVHRLLNVPLERIVVTPLGVSEEFLQVDSKRIDSIALKERYNIPVDKEIILYVGGIDQRKNISFMLEVFDDLCKERLDRTGKQPVLILAGDIEKDKQFNKFEQTRNSLQFWDQVKSIGFVPDQDLAALYSLARVFFFPSLYEGFGLPPLEAMASGTPVVSSNSSSLPEVLGDAALTFCPNNKEQAVRQLLLALEDAELARDLSARGRLRAQQFSWTKTAELTADAYHRYLSVRGGANGVS